MVIDDTPTLYSKLYYYNEHLSINNNIGMVCTPIVFTKINFN